MTGHSSSGISRSGRTHLVRSVCGAHRSRARGSEAADLKATMISTKRSAIRVWLRVAILALGFGYGFAPAVAQVCSGSWLSYFETGFEPIPNPPLATCQATGLVCRVPQFLSVTYAFVNPGCDPLGSACQVRADVNLRFPGANQDAFACGGSASTANVRLETLSGGYISDCGFAGQAICQDLGTATVTQTVSCSNGAAATDLRLKATMCPGYAFWGCEFANSLQLSFFQSAGCPVPPPDDCTTASNECRDCRPAGGGCSISVDGGLSCTFPAAHADFRYRAGGAGATSLPATSGALPWRERLGYYFSHDYAQRIVIDNATEGVNHVWLITEGASFREFKTPAAGGGLKRYDVTQTAPSDEYRQLYYCADATCGSGIPSGGWMLDYLDGRQDAFRPDGQWLSTTWKKDPNHPKIATYTGDLLTEVSFPDGRKEVFEYTGTKLTKLTEVGVGANCALQPQDCRAWNLQWSGSELAQIARPDGTVWELTYDAAKNGGRPGYLTQLRLVAGTFGRVVNAFEYNSSGRVFRSWRGDPSFTGANAIDKQEYAYVNPALPTRTTVTEWINDTPTTVDTVYDLGRDSRSVKAKVLSLAGACPACGLSPNTTFTYGDTANPLRATKVKNARLIDTLYAYNTVGRVVSKIEASGTADQRVTTYEYGEAGFPGLLTAIQVPSTTSGSRRTEMNYNDTTGALETRALKGTEAGGPAVFSTTGLVTTLSNSASGEVLTTNPPDDGTYGTADQTTFTYNLAGRNGHIPDTRTDPLGLTAQFGYDALNRRSSVIDPNGIETTTSYDSMHHVTEIRRKGAVSQADDLVTTYFYDCPGGGPVSEPPDDDPPPCREFRDLRCVQMPRGNAIEYRYDSRGRLTAITKKADCNVASQPQERTLYTLDVAGNRTMEQQQHWTASAWVTDSKTESVYSTKCHVDKIVRGKGESYESTTEFCYDENNNLTKTWDANHPRATHPLGYSRYAYDARDRLTRVTQPWGPTAAACDPENGADPDCATTLYQYDAQDHLASVTDAESNVTTYVTGDRDLMTRETSPVFSGATNFRAMVYNEHGQLKAETDPRGVTIARTLDALDRVTLIDHADSTLDTAFTYDGSAALFQKGRLVTINRGVGASVISYAYDRFGRMTQDGSLGYAYDKNGNRAEILYPDGTRACYGYQTFADRQSSLSRAEPAATCASGATAVVSAASYYPSGPLESLTLGNGIAETRLFDKRYFPVSIAASGGAGLTWTYMTDSVGNPTQIADGVLNRSYGYQDFQYFLTTGNGPWGNQSWTYDKIGNRKTETDSASNGVRTYAYATNGTGNTPKLASISPAPGNNPAGTQWTYDYDAAGNQTSITASDGELSGTDTLGYSGESKLASLGTSYGNASTGLAYDGRGFLRQSLLVYAPPNTDQLLAEPTYSSDGLLFQRRAVRVHSRVDPDTGFTNTAGTFEKTTDIFYFAGRPVAQRNSYVGGVPGLIYLTTDHLGAPMLATDSDGASYWKGGFEPFGEAYTFFGDSEMFLRFPGQWDDPSWHTSGRVADLYFNVNRWYDSATGGYTAPDPLGIQGSAYSYRYAINNPLFYYDRLGLVESADYCACCTDEGTSKEFREITNYALANGHKYRVSSYAMRGGCNAAADQLQRDIERDIGPACWITKPQLTVKQTGLNVAFYKTVGYPFYVHRVVELTPCSPGSIFNQEIGIDPYKGVGPIGPIKIGPLPPDRQIEDLFDPAPWCEGQ